MKASPEPHHHDHPAQQPDPAGGGRSFWTVLPGTADSPRRACTAIRHMLTMWDLESLIPDTELMATQLVAKAAESAPGYTIGFAISQHTTPAGQPGITCEIYDRSAQLPDTEPDCPGSEPGRGPATVAALATDSGYTTWPGGKTAWFTLTTPQPARAAEPELQSGSRPQQYPGWTPPVTDQPDPDRQRYVALTLARRALYGLAEDPGVHQFMARPSYRGGPMVTDLVPLSGVDVSRQIELAARQHARDYIRFAREAGYSWHQIGTAIGLAPDSDARQAGDTAAEAAFTYAAGHPGTEHARRYGRSVAWHCGSCDHAISDHGLCNGPADDERGHASNCTRLAATIAKDKAEWDAFDTEWEAGQ
jgi:hypothetical protein